ncbi:dimethyl sulfoxide reductase anchor subunit family protein [Thioalkalivibrio thiocyanoxidans]|uniref:dimethyl sulfoxide reductase anchor subunit family protein n=1 Tax=Thioalkalivibrio thiocyanoxidans TaxID=152475 RepID=UPI000368F125|nr:DmsC/YnfH family molybdoenzyme membrane anchor subunit [Thioalkalivibrio thiocyanoxidans]
MHPAFSVILFTVISGAGYGLFILLAAFHLAGIGPAMSHGELLAHGVASLGLITLGLVFSTGHLANKKNAWRSFMRFKTSWLSREAVFAVLFYPFAGIYGLGVLLQGAAIGPLPALAGVIAAVLAVITLFSTGMIYGCLKTIRQWNTALTPANYIMLGIATGATLFAAIATVFGNATTLHAGVAMVALVAAAVLKGIYYFWISRVNGPTINTATTFNRATVRLLDTGHTAGTFLTDEFGYDPRKDTIDNVKMGVFLLGFVAPVLVFASILSGAPAGIAWLAAVSSLVGIGMERWLFFAEAKHVVRLYHGAQTCTNSLAEPARGRTTVAPVTDPTDARRWELGDTPGGSGS